MNERKNTLQSRPLTLFEAYVVIKSFNINRSPAFKHRGPACEGIVKEPKLMVVPKS